MAKITIKLPGLIGTPEARDGRYIIRQGSEPVGFILFRAGSPCWVVCDLEERELSAHSYLRDARASAKRLFAN